jgi:enoyl-CoA hydratase/carnithine racemase
VPYEAIKYQKEQGYVIVSLNRPQRLNAIAKQTVEEIKSVIEEVTKSEETNAFIITGEPRPDGRPCFCSGADIKDIMEKGFLPSLPLLTAMQNIVAGEREGDGAFWETVARCPKISIAAIDGICSAGGLELALACDIILVSETAQIGDLHMKNVGGIGGAAVTANLSRRVGVAKAIELICTSDFIDGKEAHRIHFANQVFPPDKLLSGAKELAGKIASMRPNAIMMVKAACNAVYKMDYRTAWRFADACSAALNAAPETGKWTSRRREPPRQ